jgi:hypothetical protein
MEKDPKNKLSVIDLENNFADLVKEAKQIVPSTTYAGDLTPEEEKEFFKSKSDLEGDSSVMVQSDSQALLERLDINLGHLRHIEDRHYDVDLEYEKSRDLYAK